MKQGNFIILKYKTKFQNTTEWSVTNASESSTESPSLFNVLINSLYRTTGERSYISYPSLPSGNVLDLCSVYIINFGTKHCLHLGHLIIYSD